MANWGLVTNGKATRHVYDPATCQMWHGMLMHIGRNRGYSPKWPTASYREKFGQWPPWGSNPEPIPPSPEVLSWVRSRLIAYAKRRSTE
jgi:DNA repair protein RadD